MIPSQLRFHGHNSLRYVYANGKAVRSQSLTLKWVKNSHRKQSRISVVVSKKIIKGAIGRNRIRRRIYETIRLRVPRFDDVYDIVLIATAADLRDMPYPDLEALIDQLFTKADLYNLSGK